MEGFWGYHEIKTTFLLQISEKKEQKNEKLKKIVGDPFSQICAKYKEQKSPEHQFSHYIHINTFKSV